MVTDELPRTEKLKLHYIDHDPGSRARFVQIAMQLGHHCELYDDLAELTAHSPQAGILVLRDDPAIGGGLVNAIQSLDEMGIWLSVIAIGEDPQPQRIVDAIKAGALDYLTLPGDQLRLARCFSRISVEDKQNSSLRRRRVEAQRKISRLSERERQVLNQLVGGQSNKAIARALGISPRTVEIHRSNMMSKLEASHAVGAVRIALEAGHALA
ncbi:MAG: LuxR C-terminal-related transcriptional regulator [Parvularcula sp.]|jgi:FixJ family two-component response regulator|nr:LuxR C-terminal-related transcriptional regulator [Parvularcula sp.]